jgi:hypothetical protein
VSVLLALLLAVAGVLAALLLLPFDVRAAGAIHDGEVDGQLRARWAFGLVSIRLGRGGLRVGVLGLGWRPAARTRAPREPSERAEDREERPDRRVLGRLRAALRERGPLLGIARRLLAALHPRLRLAGRIGAGDPADTAALSAALSALARAPGVSVEVEPDWLDDVLELEARGTARVWPIEVLVTVAGILLEQGHRAALRSVWSGA